jgi:hypothetical protein
MTVKNFFIHEPNLKVDENLYYLYSLFQCFNVSKMVPQ